MDNITDSNNSPQANIIQASSINTSIPDHSKRKTIIVIILLIFLYPIGVIFMLFLTKWKPWLKLLITLPIILIPLFLILSVNPQDAINKAATKKASCNNICRANPDFNTCYNLCLQAK